MKIEDKKANKITLAEVAAVSGIALALAVGLVALLYVGRADATEVHRGGGSESLHVTTENGVVVYRGNSNYPVSKVRESSNTPAVSEARQDMDAWFRAYDAWRARTIYRKINPRP